MEGLVALFMIGLMVYLFVGSAPEGDNFDYDRDEIEMDMKALSEEKKIIRRLGK